MEGTDAPVGGIQRVADGVLVTAKDELCVSELDSCGDSLDEEVESFFLGNKGVVMGVIGEIVDERCGPWGPSPWGPSPPVVSMIKMKSQPRRLASAPYFRILLASAAFATANGR